MLGTQGASIYYNIACLYSLKKDVVNAIKSLRKAMELDFKLKENAKVDPAFDNIRDTQEFKELLY